MSRARKLQKVAAVVRRRRHAKSDPLVYRCRPSEGVQYRNHDLRRSSVLLTRVCARCASVWAKPR